MLGKNLIQAAAGNAGAAGGLGVEDVFSTWLYTGNGSTQTITNGIDLAGEGGLVWLKKRSNVAGHYLVNTARGNTKSLRTDTSGAESTNSIPFNSFNADGFTLGADSEVNSSLGHTMVSWTFRKAPKFFDIVTYTGTGSARTVAHNLGSVPGCIIVKRIDDTSAWRVYHRSLGAGFYSVLNGTAAAVGPGNTDSWNGTQPTDAVFSLGTNPNVNASGGSYIAYLFAHDAGGFGDDGTESVISCGSYTSSTRVQLGWEPQFVIIKGTESTSAWEIFDTARGFRLDVTEGSARLEANTSSAEASSNRIAIDSTGFTTNFISGVYIAIRRGPINTPTDATKVFNAVTYVGDGTNPRTITTGINVDLHIVRQQSNVAAWAWEDRLRGSKVLNSSSITADGGSTTTFDVQDGWKSSSFNNSTIPYADLSLSRAPSFFDVVAFTYPGTATIYSHSLGVAPELIIQKARNSTSNWYVYHKNLNADRRLHLNGNDAEIIGGVITAVSSTTFSTNLPLGGGTTFINYLFATCPGVSKVGSYTGTGTTLNVDCGFTAGARFVLIKRKDSTGDWYAWDTARGIVSGNDPFLLLNSTAAQNTSTDYIDPLASGFQISSTAPAAINASGGNFIYLAIA